ncbi:MAG: hypothetical protein WDZ69_02300 [Candidatus Pacearchaeota archaeon]
MDKKNIVIVILSLAILVGIFSFYLYDQEKTIKDFDVVYYSEHSSSGGDRILNITYSVRDGTITSCEGSYFFSGTDGDRTEPCDLTKLKNQESPFVVQNLITEYSKGEKMSDEVIDGPSRYSWQIILK